MIRPATGNSLTIISGIDISGSASATSLELPAAPPLPTKPMKKVAISMIAAA